MSKYGICGADTFWTGAKLWEAHSWLCRSCLQKAGGYSSAPLFGTLDDIKKAIEKNEAIKEHLLSTAMPFTTTQKVDGFLEIDEDQRLWLVPGRGGSRIDSVIHSFDDIVDIELIQDGHSLIKGGLGSAFVGGAVAGIAGALVGGITASRTNKRVCTDLRIKITLNSIKQPVEYIRLIVSQTNTESIAFRSAADAAQKCLSIFQVILSSRETSQCSTSDADEILKFKKLMDQGIITKEEFEAKKKQLLGL